MTTETENTVRAKDQVDDLRKARGSHATYVLGHALRSEGNAYVASRDYAGEWYLSYTWKGVGLCSCGATSVELLSNNLRKKWHRQHKLDVISEATR